MVMTDEQRYSAVLKELGEVLQDKNTTISCQRWQIDELKEKLVKAEQERNEARWDCDMANEQLEAALEETEHMRKLREAEKERAAIGSIEVRKAGNEIFLLLDNEAIEVLRAINAELCRMYTSYHGRANQKERLFELQEQIKKVLPINGGAA